MLNLKTIEKEVKEFWKKSRIYEKLLARKGKNFFVLDGPPYANFIPHVGHIKNTVFKDLVIRKAFMDGNKVLFQPGFDTHGLPVENMVEKKLGLQSKKDIEKFGIANFMKSCKENAALNKDIWMKVYDNLGSMYALKEPYLTYENYYIESGWWSFAQIYKKGFLYEGERPVMWCPHCETSLAGYEVTDSYKDVDDPGVYVLFKLKNEDVYLLVYTTTPWTLPANVAIAVASKENYVKIDAAGKKIILAKERLIKLSEIGISYTILEEFEGKELIGKEYKPLLDTPLQRELTKGKKGKAHIIIASIPLLKERVASKLRTKKSVEGEDVFEEFVTVSEGTGLVHTAPGHGKTDYFVGQNYKLASPSPLNDKCYFTEGAGFEGFVKDCDKKIMEKLEAEGKLLFKETIRHSYPLCWRCKSPLIFRLSNQLFFKVDKIKELMLKENEKVNWMPEFARERFRNWIANAEDWNISRQRYWGIPIPIWRCECGEERIVRSKKELEMLSKKEIKDLHIAEDITFNCLKCSKKMKKLKGIIDVWFDSGIAPWASLGYPEKNKALFEKHFPVGRINEAQDQIRGWFYSLMFCSTAIWEKAPYEAVSMTGWVIDSKGDKMSKSEGNVIDAEDAINELGADMLRFYFCWDVAPYHIQKFNVDIAKKEIGRLFNVLWNLQNLISTDSPEKKDEKLIEDKWMLSRLNSLIKEYTEDINKFELNTAMRKLSDFLLNDLSRSYIQMTRERNTSKIIAACLKEVVKLIAPISPFISEKIWQNLKNSKIVQEESVHLAKWPDCEKSRIDKKLEAEFELAIKIIEAGMAARDKAKIGLRWPLPKAKVFCKNIPANIKPIISRQLNIKEISFEKGEELNVMLDTTLTPELEAEGYLREIARAIQDARKKANMKKGELINIALYASEKLKKTILTNKEFLKERVNANEIIIDDKQNLGTDTKTIKIRTENISFKFLSLRRNK